MRTRRTEEGAPMYEYSTRTTFFDAQMLPEAQMFGVKKAASTVVVEERETLDVS